MQIFKELINKFFSIFIFNKYSIKVIDAIIKYYWEGKKNKLKNELKSVGKNFRIGKNAAVHNAKYISIGDDFIASYNFRIEAYDEFLGMRFNPVIQIGNNVGFNTDCHIGCINYIEIGNDVLFASRVYISDHSHGNADKLEISIPVNSRPLISKGKVVIQDNVWVGEGVCILPNVTIGKNSIIGANSVVTKDIPENSIVAGVPGKVIRSILESSE